MNPLVVNGSLLQLIDVTNLKLIPQQYRVNMVTDTCRYYFEASLNYLGAGLKYHDIFFSFITFNI